MIENISKQLQTPIRLKVEILLHKHTCIYTCLCTLTYLVSDYIRTEIMLSLLHTFTFNVRKENNTQENVSYDNSHRNHHTLGIRFRRWKDQRHLEL